MDRHKALVAGCGVVLLLVAPGCRSTRSEVPPGRPYGGDGRPIPSMPSTGFSSEPRPSVSMGTNYPGNVGPGGTAPQYGTPAPGAGERYGAPTPNAYGPPGTSPLGNPPAVLPSDAAGNPM